MAADPYVINRISDLEAKLFSVGSDVHRLRGRVDRLVVAALTTGTAALMLSIVCFVLVVVRL